MSGQPGLLGILEAKMEVFGLDLIEEYIVMMERPSRTLKIKMVSNNVYC